MTKGLLQKRWTPLMELKRVYHALSWKGVFALLSFVGLGSELMVRVRCGSDFIGTSGNVPSVQTPARDPVIPGMNLDSRPVTDLDVVKWPRQLHGDDTHGIVGAIYKHQNPKDCNAAKYLVWRFPLSARDARNIGALYSTIQAWLAYAMQTDRILVLDARNWKLTDSRCYTRNTECYFRPISSCHLPFKPNGVTSLRAANELDKKTFESQVVEFEGAWWPLKATLPFRLNVTKPGGGSEILGMLSKPKTITRWSSAALMYMWRPQADLEREIDRILGLQGLSNSIVPEKTIAMPVRASDKCHGHTIKDSASGEEDCLTLEQYMKVAQTVREKEPAVDTIIFTSESADMVEQSRKYSKDGWKFVYNENDSMPGTGSTNLATLKKSTSVSLGIQSAIVSLHMLLRAKYFILPYKPTRRRPYSSWLLSIGALCRQRELTFLPETFVVDVFTGNFYSSLGSDEDFAK
eukprot:CAMPEP_0114533556 /NCGR_PEP_ID=MMETSP0109-20121206/27314_1 /TAXON_ID=29199 /ORGANISM="Chlorarachnion reptans, Strain CCCM449" /LENGTH=462 /DNA_ID=CAMNT_0001716799 /DNA_START=239 /DNA_END=1627 /DNA_ORIENTATION=-